MSRYIDAEEVEKRIDVVIGSEPKAWDKKALKELKMYIVHAVPSADVRENVRGEWEDAVVGTSTGYTYHEKRCSICGHSEVLPMNFCPNCGADMRGVNMAKYYDCSCYIPYPNENHRFKNGKSKCDRYRPVKFTRKSIYGCVTRCKRVTERADT